MSRATRDDVFVTIHETLYAEYGPGQAPAAQAILRALEDEGVHHDGWVTDEVEEPT